MMSKIERPAAVYRCYDDFGHLLYVGTTNSLMRFFTHDRGSPWFSQVAGINVTHYKTRLLALKEETRAIIKEHPIYNLKRR